ncbi:hypothetical protein TVAG_439530 [Trichomonas vaginalis G3]|uniref:DUF3447 domain-containing protein n=1 Tax=Trichomonas vaginalis (strain ATCC PRA-98 / G3) TaxID=412133 RepID=A2FAH2_TRIV3|nr:temperature-gated cation channel protein [Trichomonas vaginalis G3]EAX98109.1 hypothetical protein TVAG_439530 [Trichomonas vaginalis G3]KAI5484429.1 temperature-gated cation channel protein [Trichomonas vaginalis G3]|eukprot:XP_001311039.1 hypothetical protein [Trichomonas vaginalis G3]
MREFQIDNECLNCAIGSHNNKFVEYILDHDLAELNKIDFDTIYYSQNVKALFLLYEKDPNSIIPWCTPFPQTIDILKSGNINLSTIKQQLQTLFDY